MLRCHASLCSRQWKWLMSAFVCSYRNTQHTCGSRRGMTINLAEWSIGQGQDIEFGPDVNLISVSWAHLIGTTTQYTGAISADQSEAALVPSWPIRGRPRNLDTSVGGARLSWLLFPVKSSPCIVRMGADMGGSPVPAANCQLWAPSPWR